MISVRKIKSRVPGALVLALALAFAAGCDDPMKTLVAYNLTVQSGGNGATSPSGVQSVNNGVPVTVTATPSLNYRFVNWTVISGTGVTIGDETAAGTSVTLTSGDAVIQANFQYMGIRITSPNGGELFIPGNNYPITWWADSYTGNVKIELVEDTTSVTIAANEPNDGSFSWTVPSDQFEAIDYKIRITTISGDSWTDESDANFAINRIKVAKPNGPSDVLLSGSSYYITWTSNGIGNVSIELLTGGTPSTLISSTPNDGSYPWDPISCAGGTDYKIRITHLATGSVDESDASFGVLESITVTSPNSGDIIWEQGTAHDVTWASQGAGNVRIDLYRGVTLDHTITDSTPNDGSFSWNIGAQAVRTDYRIRINSTEYTAISDESDASFTVEKMNVLAPNGGQCLARGDVVSVTWTSSGAGNAVVSLNNGGSLTTLDTVANSVGSYTWTVPGGQAAGGNYKIRVTRQGTSIYDESDAVFVVENIVVASPNGGEVWKPGTAHNVTWTSSGAGNVRIDLYKNGSPSAVIANPEPNDGSYSWIIPGGYDLASDYRVRVTALSNTAIFDESNGNFTIEGITVTSPNGGEALLQGGSHVITWSSAKAGNVRIDLYKGGSLLQNIVDDLLDNGTYTWSIGALALGYDYSIRVTSKLDEDHYDNSDSEFIIESISLTSPVGGEAWIPGSSHNITWDSSRGGNVNIDLYKGASLALDIATGTANDGTYSWPIDDGQTLGTDYSVRVSHAANSTIFDQSGGTFTIDRITVTSPNGGEVLELGSSHNITWTSSGGGSVGIDLYEGGSYKDTIVSGITNTGSYPWTVNSDLAGDYRIRVYRTPETSIYDESNANFTIEQIGVSAPTGGTFALGGAVNIEWSSSRAGNVNIDLYKGGTLFSNIASDTANDGAYTWTIPGGQTLGTDYSVRVSHDGNSAINSQSGTFVIEGLTVTSPNGGEVLKLGASANITWASTGANDVRIDLYKGGYYINTIAANAPNTGSYPWTPSGLSLASNYSIRITAFWNPTLYDDSNSNFTIDNINVLYPNILEYFGRQRSYYTITWESCGSGSVRIDLYKGGSFYSSITTSTENDGAFSWTIPVSVELGSDYRIRVSNLSNSSVYDASSNDFTIVTIEEALINAPINPTTSTDIDITVSGAHIIAYRYSLDYGDWTDETSLGVNIQVSGLSIGSHNLSVRGKDEEGAWTSLDNALTYTWEIIPE